MVEIRSFDRLKLLRDKFRSVQLAGYSCLDFAQDDCVFISGSGRSGTSWLANICNFRNDFRYIFEPLNPSNIDESEKIEWCLTSEMSSPYLDKILQGRISNKWVNSRNRKRIAKRRLIKEIRSNFMLHWINTNYPKIKIVFLLRNPLAVAASRKKLESLNENSNWVWHPELRELLSNPILRSRISTQQFLALSEQVGKGIEMETIAEWCINNLVACDEGLMSRIHLVYYENLITNGDKTIFDLLNYINVPINENLANVVQQRSETSRSGLKQSKSMLNDWTEVLSSVVIAEATELLKLFDLSRFYSVDGVPQKGS